ncbi:hypothetical protein FB451DRAFT_1385911 [Mycena latifolia]|nr:hypothetical protein FB451DRAFT_1385911 [Mycena latifolia]
MSSEPMHSPPVYSNMHRDSGTLRSALKHTSSPPLTSRSASPTSLISPVLASSPPLPSPSPHLSHIFSPTAPGYTPKVSFDTFENPAASMFSFTLQVKNAGYARTRSTRVPSSSAHAERRHGRR